MPPSDNPPKYCTVQGCLNEAWSGSFCQKHWADTKAGKKPSSPRARVTSDSSTKVPTPEPTTRKITRAEVEAFIIPGLVFLGTFVDEAWEPGTVVDGPQGRAVIMKPHVQQAITQMTPWFEIYGSSFARYAPWFGLASGCVSLAMPAMEPTLEIIAGVRKPRISRRDSSDIYTDEFLRAKAEMQKKAAQKRDDVAPASKQTVPVTIVPPPANSGGDPKADERSFKAPNPDMLGNETPEEKAG